jgi:hypothetical protein
MALQKSHKTGQDALSPKARDSVSTEQGHPALDLQAKDSVVIILPKALRLTHMRQAGLTLSPYLNPSGFALCQRQALSIIDFMSLCSASQPSSFFALEASA